MKKLFIVNQNAGKEEKDKIINIIEECMGKTSNEYEIFIQDIREQNPRDLFKDVDHVIAVGGDGTINTCINKILSTEIRKFSILPTGSGNDFARMMGISKDIHKSLKKILENNSRKIDVGKWNDHVFLNIASVGFDADVNEKANRKVLGRYGSFGFIVSLIQQIFFFSPKKISFKDGSGKKEENWAIFTICNGKYYGGGIPICKKADPSDGQLNLLAIESSRFHIIIPFIISLFLRKSHRWKKGFYRKTTRQLNFQVETPCNVNLDGENHWWSGPVKVEILPGEIDLIQ